MAEEGRMRMKCGRRKEKERVEVEVEVEGSFCLGRGSSLAEEGLRLR